MNPSSTITSLWAHGILRSALLSRRRRPFSLSSMLRTTTTTYHSTVALRTTTNLAAITTCGDRSDGRFPWAWWCATAAVAVISYSFLDHDTQRCSCDSTSYAREMTRYRTIRKIKANSTKDQSLESKYKVDWEDPIGEGAFGTVFYATPRTITTGIHEPEPVAVKKISKKLTDDTSFQREMNALLHLQKAGGHPNICSLREHFEEDSDDQQYYYLVFDLVNGGEMFDHLVRQGPYSEADAARLVREVASALAFIHGLDTVHGDLKPENILLSSENPSDAAVKLVDFGCAQVSADDSIFEDGNDIEGDPNMGLVGRTIPYCPPEVLDPRRKQTRMDPSMDMWALGIVLYIMLTGRHPYDLTGKSSDDEITRRVVAKKAPPLYNSPITSHLSDSAKDLIQHLLSPNAKKRMTALEMLDHPWVKGETARRSKIAGSDKKLSAHRVFKSRIEAKVFADIVNWSDSENVSKRTSVIEQTFREFDQGKGYITAGDLQRMGTEHADTSKGDTEAPESAPLTLSGFSDILAENMKNRYFPKGHIVYHEGDIGNHMYILNSGFVEITTRDGSRATRGPGNFFGEGALMNPTKIRSATIRCQTPVHAMEISREFFEKYLATSDPGLFLTLREKDKIRKRNRAKTVLRRHKDLEERDYEKGDRLFTAGEKGDSLFVVEIGRVDVQVNGKSVMVATPGNVCGEHSLLTGRKRNSTAVCSSDDGCIAYEMVGDDFRKLAARSPEVVLSLRDLCARRDFKKAVVFRLKNQFPYENPRLAFDAVRTEDCAEDELTLDAVGRLMREMHPDYSDEEVLEVVRALDLNHSGSVSFEEFKKVFIANIKTSAAM